MDITITPSSVSGSISSPSSKSFAQRAVAISLLCKGVSKLYNIGMCNDTAASISVARNLGADIEYNNNNLIINSNGIVLKDDVLNIGESGLSTRLFTPLASLLDKPVTICGEGSILSRPIDMMKAPLTEAGVHYKSNNGYLPVEVRGPMIGGEINIDGSMSSQFLTGMLISLPLAKKDSILHVKELKSKPYIDMTLETMKAFGIEVENNNYNEFFIRGGQSYNATSYNIEGDWSGASCMLVAGITSGDITLSNLSPKSKQADMAIIHAFNYAGASLSLGFNEVTTRKSNLESFSFDATECPDLFPALVALAAACEGRTTILGTSRLTHKESNRAETLKSEFEKLGVEIDISYDNLMMVYGQDKIRGNVVIDSHKDHRIAMATAVTALRADSEVIISGAEAVNKSYTNFWNDLKAICTSSR